MHQKIKNIINNYKDEETTLNKIIVSIFIKANNIKVKKNDLIKSLLISKKSNLSQIIDQIDFVFNFDDLIEGFELAIPSSEKTTNGAVYTPTYIKDFIVDNSFNKINKPYHDLITGDVSCGCGAFLFTIVNKLKLETNKSFYNIFRDNIFGLDISKSSIERTKILLTLLAIYYSEDVEEFDFNLYTSNALSFDWNNIEKIKSNEGFDLIVGNPPYVRAKNIDGDSKILLKNWVVTKSGNPDLYIPFFEIGLKNLNERGILGYITVNSFYKSVNARELRKYLEEKECKIEIIDFGNEKIFVGKSAYTCICFISKEKSKSIYFKKETGKSLTSRAQNQFNEIPYANLDFHKGWLLNDTEIIKNIKKIESTGKSLGDKYIIKNGIATLKNDIYIFKPIAETTDYYILMQNEIRFEIEKAICKDIIKPNILKHEHEIESIKEKLIYPYTNGISPFSIMTEEYLSKNFPKAYEYLLFNKKDLEKRDKGEGNYCAWYAFGRTQALTDKGLKLLFPYMGKKPHFVFTDQKDMLLYCGYAIFNESAEELKILKRILESKVFEYYVKHTSKPYSGGYFSYAKNYVKNFGICELNDKEKHFLSNGSTDVEVNDFLIKKYNLII